MLSNGRGALRLLARRALYPACEASWAAVLRAAAPLLTAGARPRSWGSPGGQRVLVVAAHPDDETVGCGGTILLHKRQGDSVTALVVTDGGKARGAGLPADRVAAIRSHEARQAARVLGLDELQQWGLPEGRWDVEQLACRLAGYVQASRPEVVYAHSLVDYHPEHRKLARALALALQSLPGARPALRVYELAVPLGPLTNLVAELAPVATRKRAAVLAYRSQRDVLSVDRRRTRYNAALFGLPGPAEAFWELTAPAYAAIMSRDPGPMYRSLRERPLMDMLAYVDFGRRRRETRGQETGGQRAEGGGQGTGDGRAEAFRAQRTGDGFTAEAQRTS